LTSRPALAALILLWLFPAFAGAEEPITRPHLDHAVDAREAVLNGQAYINHGLVGAGRLAADTVDFLGDTLGSFSSLQVDPKRWKRVGDHYEGLLWTLPDRGRNDPASGLFFDYPARLERFRLRFSPNDGRLDITPDGGVRLTDFLGKPFTGADPGGGVLSQRGRVLPAPAAGVGRGKVSLDAEALQLTADGGFYVGDEYAANVYAFDRRGRLRGIIAPPLAIAPRRDGRTDFNSLQPPQSGRRNNQGLEGVSLSPDGRTLLVALQSALIQDSAAGGPAGRTATRVLVYDVSRDAAPARPVGHYVVQLPAYNDGGDGGAPNRTAAQSEIRALDGHRFLMLSRDAAGRGAASAGPIVYKSVLLVDLTGATNLAGGDVETGVRSVLGDPATPGLRADIAPAAWVELVNMLNPEQLARHGLGVEDLSEKWEALDLVSTLEPDRPADYFLFVGNDNDFIARRCTMSGQVCDSDIDNENRVLVYRLTLPAPLR